MKKVILLIVIILSGCASIPSPRPEYTNIPTLEKGWARLYFTAGKIIQSGYDRESIFSINLKYETQLGSVYINNLKVDSIAYLEHFAVDLLPGVYEVYWDAPISCLGPFVHEDVPCPTFPDKRTLNIKAGQIRYFACDWIDTDYDTSLLAELLGSLSDHWKISERPSFDSKSKLVSYFKYPVSDEITKDVPE